MKLERENYTKKFGRIYQKKKTEICVKNVGKFFCGREGKLGGIFGEFIKRAWDFLNKNLWMLRKAWYEDIACQNQR